MPMTLPPYGKPSVERSVNVLDPNEMNDWSSGNAAWIAWRERYVEDISNHVWPKYDEDQEPKWVGGAAAFAQDASDAELDLMVSSFQNTDIISDLVRPPLHDSALNPHRNHLWHFYAEDRGGVPEGASEFEEKASVTPFSNIAFFDSHWAHLSQLVGSISQRKLAGLFSFKMNFQRPRPQQAAFILGKSDFEYRNANNHTHTGLHPSLPSGHCLQGFLLTCALVEMLGQRGALDGYDLRGLKQYAVDFGDRRVFAGVHYPTDNIASWVIVLRLIPEIFEAAHRPEIMAFALDAIQNYSRVFELIDDNYDGHQDLAHAYGFLRSEISNAQAYV